MKQTEGHLACESTHFSNYLKLSKELVELNLYIENYPDLHLNNTVEEILPQKLDSTVIYSYSVLFEESDVEWASRWDQYLYMSRSSEQVHWLSIVDSFAVILLLIVAVVSSLRNVICKDVAAYHWKGLGESEGWEQVSEDVFRPPVNSMLFAVTIGSGAWLFVMALATLVLLALGFVSPEYRGYVLKAMLLTYMLMGYVAGYISARLYKMFGGNERKRIVLLVAVLYPGMYFAVFFVINCAVWMEESSTAVDFVELTSLLVVWFALSFPSVLLGAVLGFRKKIIQNPYKVNRIPRLSMKTPICYQLKVLSFIAGSLPFACTFIEVSYIMRSVWNHQLFYCLFVVLLLCYFVLAVVSSLAPILVTYIAINKEEHRWWWLSFWVAGSSGVYLMGYSVLYQVIELNLTRVSSFVLYYGYMMLLSVAFSLITGSIGFLATFLFVRRIYSKLRN